MKPGDLVCVIGGFDTRVRSHDKTKLVFGTLDSFFSTTQVMVLLENGDIWVGDSKYIKPAAEQT